MLSQKSYNEYPEWESVQCTRFNRVRGDKNLEETKFPFANEFLKFMHSPCIILSFKLLTNFQNSLTFETYFKIFYFKKLLKEIA